MHSFCRGTCSSPASQRSPRLRRRLQRSPQGGSMIREILVGYDGSEASGHALTFAAGLARAFGSSLHVLAVVRPPEFGGMVETEAVIEQSRKHQPKRATRSVL